MVIKNANFMMLVAWRASCCRWPSAWRYFATQLQVWQVSSHGRICNTKGFISQGSLHPSGYRVSAIDGQNWKVHRVVKIMFHGLPSNAAAWQVNHLDGDSSNNRLDNLVYATHSENIRHSFSNPSRGRCGPAKSKPVAWRPIGSTIWTVSPSTRLAAEQLGMSHTTVSKCCISNSVANGYEFKFKDPFECTLPGEEWQPMLDPVSGTEVIGRMVSSFGRITSKSGVTGRGCLNSTGYFTTEFRINGTRQGVLVHRLVAFAFLGPPPSVHQKFVNHKDLDKGNNAVDNLEWVSCVENHAHFHANATRKSRSDVQPVLGRLYGSHNPWTWHPSSAEAANKLGLDGSSVSKCARGILRKTGGYEFRFAEVPTAGSLPGEEWQEVDLLMLQRDKEARRFESNKLRPLRRL